MSCPSVVMPSYVGRDSVASVPVVTPSCVGRDSVVSILGDAVLCGEGQCGLRGEGQCGLHVVTLSCVGRDSVASMMSPTLSALEVKLVSSSCPLAGRLGSQAGCVQHFLGHGGVWGRHCWNAGADIATLVKMSVGPALVDVPAIMLVAPSSDGSWVQ